MPPRATRSFSDSTKNLAEESLVIDSFSSENCCYKSSDYCFPVQIASKQNEIYFDSSINTYVLPLCAARLPIASDVAEVGELRRGGGAVVFPPLLCDFLKIILRIISVLEILLRILIIITITTTTTTTTTTTST